MGGRETRGLQSPGRANVAGPMLIWRTWGLRWVSFSGNLRDSVPILVWARNSPGGRLVTLPDIAILGDSRKFLGVRLA